MKTITLVTGNPNKLLELKAIFPSEFNLQSRSLDLDEIQSLDLEKIINHKLEQAYAKVKKPVIVDDVSAELDMLNGLPGPFVKYFEEKLGAGALYKLTNEKGSLATIRCVMGYYDGSIKYVVTGEVRGKIVAPRGSNGFGFDCVFMLDGETRTNAEMSLEEKNTKSHRVKAIKALLVKLKDL